MAKLGLYYGGAISLPFWWKAAATGYTGAKYLWEKLKPKQKKKENPGNRNGNKIGNDFPFFWEPPNTSGNGNNANGFRTTFPPPYSWICCAYGKPKTFTKVVSNSSYYYPKKKNGTKDFLIM